MQDWDLLQEFVKRDSQRAFSLLVERHLNFVYSTCLRELGDRGLAEDATQVVFLLLSQKANKMRPGTVVTGWLFHTACFVSKNARKQEYRWHKRTQKAVEAIMHETTSHHSTENHDWEQIQPLLHDALNTLKPRDRNAVLLRLFEERSLKETGEALGISEDAARKCVARALEKLRDYFSRHGVTLSVAAMAALLGAHTVQAAPATLVSSMSVASLTSSSVAVTGTLSTQTLTWAANVNRAWMLVKLKMAATAVCGVLFLGAATRQLLRHKAPVAPSVRVAGVAQEKRLVLKPLVAKSLAARATTSLAGERRKAGREEIETREAEALAPSKAPVIDPMSQMEPPLPVDPQDATVRRTGAHSRLRKIVRRPIQKRVGPDNSLNSEDTQIEVPITEPDIPSEDIPVQPPSTPTRDDVRSSDINVKKVEASALMQEPAKIDASLPHDQVVGQPVEGEKGTLTGILTARGNDWIEVRADDQEVKRYSPIWLGGLAKDGGSFDKVVLARFKELVVSNRVTVDWIMDKGQHVTKVQVVAPAEKTGKIEGLVTAKDITWIEVKGVDGIINRYTPVWVGGPPVTGGGLDRDMLRAIGGVKVGDQVRLEWKYEERLSLVALEKQ